MISPDGKFHSAFFFEKVRLFERGVFRRVRFLSNLRIIFLGGDFHFFYFLRKMTFLPSFF